MRQNQVCCFLLAVLIGCHAAAPTVSSAPVTIQCCEPLADPTASDLSVESRTGTLTGKLDYPTNERVRVVVRNINPFLYDYRMILSTNPWPEVSPAEFFDLAFGIKLAPAAAPAALVVDVANMGKLSS